MAKVKIFYGINNGSSSDKMEEKIEEWQKRENANIISVQSSITSRYNFSEYPFIITILYEDNAIKL